MKIVFMGTPDFAKESLENIYNAGHEILAVVTNPDRPKGRGMKMVMSPVKEFAIEKKITVYQPQTLRQNTDIIEKIRSLNPDVICVVAYGKILPKEILELPKLVCINVHGSLLPKYRGAAPIQWAVINGDKTTGITTMYMDEGMDTGDIILKQEVTIGEDETTGELWDRLSKIGGKLLVETLEKIKDNTAPRQKQQGDFSIAPMLKKEIAKINWEERTAREIKNLIRGLNPIMGAYTFINGKKIKFWKVELLDNNKIEQEEIIDENIDKLENGTVILSDSKIGLFIKAKEGIINVIEIQGENAKKMPVGDFLRGNIIKQFEKFN